MISLMTTRVFKTPLLKHNDNLMLDELQIMTTHELDRLNHNRIGLPSYFTSSLNRDSFAFQSTNAVLDKRLPLFSRSGDDMGFEIFKLTRRETLSLARSELRIVSTMLFCKKKVTDRA